MSISEPFLPTQLPIVISSLIRHIPKCLSVIQNSPFVLLSIHLVSVRPHLPSSNVDFYSRQFVVLLRVRLVRELKQKFDKLCRHNQLLAPRAQQTMRLRSTQDNFRRRAERQLVVMKERNL